jgi:oligopeptidase B
VEQGWVIATSHPRGEGERGAKWHQAGTFKNKQNSIQDFLSCAQYLIKEGYTKPDYMAAHGSSAGGLMVGQAVNLMPELFKSIVLEVPFVDPVSVMLDESLPLTIPEREEWGDPIRVFYIQDEEIYEYMRGYSPYENVWNAKYPAFLITLGLKDARVPYWTILKYVKRLRERGMKHHKTELCQDNIAVDVQDSGHFGNNTLENEAFLWGYLNTVIPGKLALL